MSSSLSSRSSKVHFDTTCKTEVGADVKQLYKVIKKHSGAVGGYGHNGPVYGEITMVSFQKIVDYLCENLDFGSHSTFMDIGAGLGKPNLHVAVNPGVEYSFGVEIERLRWQLGMHNLRYCIKDESINNVVQKKQHPNVYFAHNDVTDIKKLDPFSHIYMFDIGFPPAVLVHIAGIFNTSKTAKCLVSFQRPRTLLNHGFQVECIEKITTRMCGSSEGHTAYIYRHLHNPVNKPTDLTTITATATSTITTTTSRKRKETSTSAGPKAKRYQQTQFKRVTRGWGKVLFPTSGAKATPSGGIDAILQAGFDMLRPTSTPAEGGLGLVSDAYTFYVEGSGGLLDDTSKTRARRTPAKRTLAY